MSNENQVYALLRDLEIEFVKYEHEAVYTVEEARAIDANIPGQHCKNLFLRNRKGNKHYLVILDQSKPVDLKALSHRLGSTNLSFASKERLQKYLGVEPGSVTPFAVMNDSDSQVIVILDQGLDDLDLINFHPNVNTATLGVSYSGLKTFLDWCGNKVILLAL